MKRNYISFLFFFLIWGLVVGCSSSSNQPIVSSPTPNGPAVPSDYVNLKNPKTGDAAAVAQGKQIYSSNCIGCHGDTGKGDGPHAADLNPRPAPLAELQSGRSDGYLFWRISEGGLQAPFNSSMPSWKAAFNADQIWSLVSYIRSLPK